MKFNLKTFLTDTINNRMIMTCMAYQNGVSIIGDMTIEDISDMLKREHTHLSGWVCAKRTENC
jgi:hypothetical protein